MKTDLIYMRMIELACQILSDLAISNHHYVQNYDDATTGT